MAVPEASTTLSAGVSSGTPMDEKYPFSISMLHGLPSSTTDFSRVDSGRLNTAFMRPYASFTSLA
ncbi:unknown [Bacteroides sp. CAG:1060]|nr:unknown [Bacteroides sp. CAG:1060]